MDAEVVAPMERVARSRVWLVVAGWTSFATINALILRAQEGVFFPYALQASLVLYSTLGVLVWISCSLHARFGIQKRSLLVAAAFQLVLGLACICVWVASMLGYYRLWLGPRFWAVVFERDWMWQLLSTTLTYGASVFLGLAVQGFDRERERQRREAQLEVTAREAELTAIRAQLQPHFLFNSLNSILALVEQDPAQAKQMLTRLASLLQSAFDRLDEPLVPLDRELETVRDYLEIERIRFGDRLTFSIDAGRDARQVPVPPFLLQPIVENAVKHGVEPLMREGSVRVTARLEHPFLHVAICDTGPGFNDAGPPAAGRGLALTQRRLQAVYGDGTARLETRHGADGFGVTLQLPIAGPLRVPPTFAKGYGEASSASVDVL